MIAEDQRPGNLAPRTRYRRVHEPPKSIALPPPPSPDDIWRELSATVARSEAIGRRIEAHLDDAEREIDAIRQSFPAPSLSPRA